MTTFDRVRPRREPTARPAREAPLDVEGKRALFSAATRSTPAIGSVTVECSSCRAATVLSPVRALRLAVPSLHFGLAFGGRSGTPRLRLLPRPYPSWMRCPACGRRTWVRLTVQV